MRLAANSRRGQLIEVAMRLFSEHGFYGTTTREIAEAAGVNEAIIFRHFPTKEDLYWAVVSSRIAAVGRQRMIQEYLGSKLNDNEALARIAETLLNRTPEDTALTRLLLFSALRNPDLSESFFRTYMAEAYDLLADYFRRGTKQGRFRKVHPLIAARGFLGMISNHILVQELFRGNRSLEFDSGLVARQLTDIWLNGISAQSRRAKVHNGSNGRRNHVLAAANVKAGKLG